MCGTAVCICSCAYVLHVVTCLCVSVQVFTVVYNIYVGVLCLLCKIMCVYSISSVGNWCVSMPVQSTVLPVTVLYL